MRLSTGIEGLDGILNGGLLPGRAYLVHGGPGTGKTTLGLHFLSAGEESLLITFAQSSDQIRAAAGSLGLKTDHVRILDLTPPPEMFSEAQTYDIFSPAEVEREPITRQIKQGVDEVNPRRIFVDGFGYFQNLVSDPFLHRRFTLSFFRFATGRGATLIAASDDCGGALDADGVIHLESSPAGRTIHVTKFRGSDYRAGQHPMRLTAMGLQVFLSAA